MDVGTPGNFSGCAATGSGVVFLKPDGLWRLYGTKPDNFQLIASAALGCDLRAQGRTIERLGRDNIRAILDDAERGAEPCPAGTH